jgi:hypothetical protein
MFLSFQQHQHPTLLHCHQLLRPHPGDKRQPSSSVIQALLQATIRVDQSGIWKGRKQRLVPYVLWKNNAKYEGDM